MSWTRNDLLGMSNSLLPKSVVRINNSNAIHLVPQLTALHTERNVLFAGVEQTGSAWRSQLFPRAIAVYGIDLFFSAFVSGADALE